MTAAQVLSLGQALLAAVQKHCVLPDGAVSFVSVSADVALAQDVEAAYKALGGVVPPNVDKVIAGVVAFVSILGV
jgi:hypothetical protein